MPNIDDHAFVSTCVFSEAVSFLVCHSEKGQRMARRLQSKHGKSKRQSILAAKRGRSAHFMLSREETFQMERFLREVR